METIDTILDRRIEICQPSEGYRFNADSVILSRFVDGEKYFSNILDIGAGSGLISVLLNYLYGYGKIDAVEISSQMYECLLKTMDINKLDNVIKPFNMDLKQFKPSKPYDMIISNPPYRKSHTGRQCTTDEENRARFSDNLNLDDILKFCRSYLKNKGLFYFCYEADLAVEAFYYCRKYGIEPKRVRFLHPDIDKPARQIFLECRKEGGIELKVEKPLFQKIKGVETQEYKNIFINEDS
ncbi:tRNA1(Val) (adenine(37)-N6)-methyltransferase [Flexistipes sp.]|uniref:tRNA1(Val) (adenine(37)-N6)-methyltransferase n=1 Tax=Flexistipes sp. TaxID=3088135 RepID=UPI002E223B65|nr:methyltransferase [Flexistipes sp.]